MNKDIDARIQFAEYFAAVSDEPDRWRGYLTALQGKRDDLDRKVAQLQIEQLKGSKDEGRIDELLAEIRKIEAQVKPITTITLHMTDVGSAKAKQILPERLLQVLGLPAREITGQGCQQADNERFRSFIENADVGRFRVVMLKPAIDSLKVILTQVKTTDAALYDSLGTAGALCVRYARGSRTLSSHSFGTALDVTIDGQFLGVGTPASGQTAEKVSKLAEYFGAAGWVWGGGFLVPDPMHFEVGSELFERWVDAGIFNNPLARNP